MSRGSSAIARATSEESSAVHCGAGSSGSRNGRPPGVVAESSFWDVPESRVIEDIYWYLFAELQQQKRQEPARQGRPGGHHPYRLKLASPTWK